MIPVRTLTREYPSRANVILIDVLVGDVHDPQISATPPPKVKAKAVWDTGASNTVISTAIAQRLNLPQVGLRRTHTANGPVDSPTYLIDLQISDIVFSGFEVSVMPHIAGGVSALLGMDIITLGDFAITNVGGKTVASFCIPSKHKIDFKELEDQARAGQSLLKATSEYDRNDMVELRNPQGGATKKMKFKYAHDLIRAGWKVVGKVNPNPASRGRR